MERSLRPVLDHPAAPMPRIASPLARSAGYGVIAASRSLSAPAWAATSIGLPGRGILRLLALNEMTMDKLPFLPARTRPLLFAGRVASGALAAGLTGPLDRSRYTPVECMITGGVAAGLATVATYHLRRALTRLTRLPDPVIAVLEDAATIALGRWLGRHVEPSARFRGGPARLHLVQG